MQDDRGREDGESGAEDQRQGGEGRGQTGERGADRPAEAQGPTVAQWVVGGLSTLLVLALLAFILHQAVTGAEGPPLLDVRVEAVVPAPDGFVVEIRVHNRGGSTAARVMVEGRLVRDTTTVETSTATLAYVPAGTARDAALIFSRDPRLFALEVRPRGFDRP